jgi:bifunctional DNA-binding transcriptional regulator/antitoxin component of YhaV-PrlF toxin-antitoxin module
VQCTNPVKLSFLDFHVACGKCIACRISRAREWAVRCVHESGYHDQNVFVTLTYDDLNIPINFSLSKYEYVTWIKRFRKSLNGRKIKYLGCGDYGEKTGRPHYHFILFGVGFLDFRYYNRHYFHQTWPYGNIDVDVVNYHTARYVAKYIQRSTLGSFADVVYAGLVKPFQTQSRGIGLQYALDHAYRLRQNLGFYIDGIRHGLPRYYRKKLGIDETEYVELIARKENMYRNQYEYELTQDDLFVLKKRLKSLRQSRRELQALSRLSPRKL